MFSALLSLSLIGPVSAGIDLSPGKAFPSLSLPSIATGKKVDFQEQLGEKLMLHLFAAW